MEDYRLNDRVMVCEVVLLGSLLEEPNSNLDKCLPFFGRGKKWWVFLQAKLTKMVVEFMGFLA